MREILQRWFGRRWFGPGAAFGRKVPAIDHPVFGSLIFQQGAKGPYWLHESFTDNEVCIAIDTVETERPSIEQEKFFLEVTNNLDRYFEQCREFVAPKYSNVFKEVLPPSWREAFVLGSVGVPLKGDIAQAWEITFECIKNNSGVLFTCHFERGAVTGVTVDT
ncbi:hypothetical protein [Thiosocius teredinicola]|uniref:hypothetical protein n=1 Tax=Thiosocius teredinicola TaxID=1973002 RepID=UPI000F7A3A68